ncbi:MAG: hypothetical protein HQM08_23935 [Candidatus Riflebacteria bacterium]|nr:hypothetical protein [Candidatus Riflebacteria bacterium]
MDIESVLIRKGVINNAQLSALKPGEIIPDQWIGTILSIKGYCSEKFIAKTIAEELKLYFMDLELFFPSASSIREMPQDYSHQNMALLISSKDDTAIVGFVNPSKEIIQKTHSILRKTVLPVVITAKEFLNKLKAYSDDYSDPVNRSNGLPNIYGLSDHGFIIYNIWVERFYENGFLTESEVNVLKKIISEHGNPKLIKADSFDSFVKNKTREKHDAAFRARVEALQQKRDQEYSLQKKLLFFSVENTVSDYGKDYFSKEYPYLDDATLKEYLTGFQTRIRIKALKLFAAVVSIVGIIIVLIRFLLHHF